MSSDVDSGSTRRASGVLLVAVLLGSVIPRVGQAETAELFRSGEIEQRDGTYRVEGAASLLQIRVAPGLVLSAGSGSVFALNRLPNADESAADLSVQEGEVRVVMIDADAVYTLGPGTYRLHARVAPTHLPAETSPAQLSDIRGLHERTDRQAIYLADTAMLRQTRLLEVPTTPFVRGLLSIFKR